MVIDIDAFLKKYATQEGTSSQKEAPPQNLEFQADVERSLRDVEKNAENADLESLKKVYEEVKAFDKDLPKKFLNLGKKGEEVLEKVGERYSSQFLQREKNNLTILQNQVSTLLNNIDQSLNSSNFSQALNQYNYLLSYYRNFPREFYSEKAKVGIELRKREMQINQLLHEYKKTHFEEVRKKVLQLYSDLKQAIKRGDVGEVEEKSIFLESLMERLPGLFKPDLLDERYHVSSLLMKAEEFLYNYYTEAFEKGEKQIYALMESFRESYLESDLDKVLLYYERIISEFSSLPDTDIERKTSLYTKINKLYGKINDLVVKDNMSRFMQSYNAGKVLEEARDYIEEVKRTKQVSHANLKNLKEKVNSLPDRFSHEKSEVISNIDTLLGKIESKSENYKRISASEEEHSQKDYFNIKKELEEKVHENLENLSHAHDIETLKKLYRRVLYYTEESSIGNSKKSTIVEKANNIFYPKYLRYLEEYIDNNNLTEMNKESIKKNLEKIPQKFHNERERVLKNLNENKSLKETQKRKESQSDETSQTFDKGANEEDEKLEGKLDKHIEKLNEEEEIYPLKRNYKSLKEKINDLEQQGHGLDHYKEKLEDSFYLKYLDLLEKQLNGANLSEESMKSIKGALNKIPEKYRSKKDIVNALIKEQNKDKNTTNNKKETSKKESSSFEEKLGYIQNTSNIKEAKQYYDQSYNKIVSSQLSDEEKKKYEERLNDKFYSHLIYLIDEKISSVEKEGETLSSAKAKKLGELLKQVPNSFSEDKRRIMKKIRSLIGNNEKKTRESTSSTYNRLNDTLMEEVKSLYDRLKNTSDKEDKKELYKRIKFYLSTLDIKEEKKKEILKSAGKLVGSS